MNELMFWRARRALWRLWARLPGRCTCNVCGRRVRRFLPYRGGSKYLPPLMKELGIVGSDVDQFECPSCGSTDRERHLTLYLAQSGLLEAMPGSRVLHIAPERHLELAIRRLNPAEYVCGDLFPSRPGILTMDIQSLPFEQGYFDFVIANHVLEHVSDDREALTEIARVLRPSGNAIIQTPFSTALQHRLEDPGIHSESARLHSYGQEDHLRLYGRDWSKSFEASGQLRSNVVTHAEALPHIAGSDVGVNELEPFMWFVRVTHV